MEIEISDDDVQAFGGDRDKLASWIEGLPLETERLKARQTVIDKTQGDLRAFTDLGLTPAEIKALKDAPGSPDAKDVEKRIKDAIDAANAESTDKSNARARSAEVRAQAAELGPWNITVNAISPSMLVSDYASEQGLAAREIVARRTPLRRLGEPGEVARVVAFLVSDDARFISGANLPVTGGIPV